MSLFRRESDSSRVRFHCLGLSDTELSGITKLVEKNGGEIGINAEFPIRFIPRRKYSSDIYPSFRFYVIKFIRSCVKKSKLVDPEPFRLGPKRLGDEFMMSYLMCGHCCYKRCISHQTLVNFNDTNSEEEAAKAPTKRIKHGDVKYRLGNVRESGMLSNSESKKEGSRFARKKNGDI